MHFWYKKKEVLEEVDKQYEKNVHILCRQILVKLSNINFHENPFSGSRVVTCGQTDRQT
jgi:hypothetical protein